MTFDTTGEANGGWWSMGLDREDFTLYVNRNDGDVPRGVIAWGLPARRTGAWKSRRSASRWPKRRSGKLIVL